MSNVNILAVRTHAHTMNEYQKKHQELRKEFWATAYLSSFGKDRIIAKAKRSADKALEHFDDKFIHDAGRVSDMRTK